MADREFSVRDTRLPGHFWADNEVMDIYGHLLGALGMAVYMALCRNARNGTGECKISRRKIAAQLDMSVGSVHNALILIERFSLARLVQQGTPRTPATYVLADVKSLCNPKVASVHRVNAESEPSVHGMNANDHQVNANDHPVNAAFTKRTPNKEDKTSSRLNTDKTVPPTQHLEDRYEKERRQRLSEATHRGLRDFAKHPLEAWEIAERAAAR